MRWNGWISNGQGGHFAGRARLSRHLHRTDLHGLARLGVSFAGGLIDVAEELHMRAIGSRLGGGMAGRLSSHVYGRARSSAALAARLVDRLLDQPAAARHAESSAQREAVVAALNGFLGDRLDAAGNPLAIPMRLRRGGHPLELTREALAAALPGASGKVLVLVHGLCRCDLQWQRLGHDHGEALGQELGYTPLYLHYNTGRHISVNGREFDALLEALLAAWPVPVTELSVIGHSMGGLVARSACHYGKLAGHAWPRSLRHLVFLGTPHHGAPLERGGNWLAEAIGRNGLTAPIARLARLRSAGITDLRYGNLIDEDWLGMDRFEHTDDRRVPLPLPRNVHCYAVAGTTGRRLGDIRDRFLGDGVIPLDTALGRHPDEARTLLFPKNNLWIGFGIHHLDLLSRKEVFDKLKEWLGRPHKSRAALAKS